MAAVEENLGNLFMIDEAYEFSAPRFYDFIGRESDEDVRRAELWFERTCAYAPSPYMHRIKAARTAHRQILCNFGENEQEYETHESSDAAAKTLASDPTYEAEGISIECNEEVKTCVESHAELSPAETKENNHEDKVSDASTCPRDKHVAGKDAASNAESVQGAEVCTPALQKRTERERVQTAKKIASRIKSTKVMNSKNRLQKAQVKDTQPTSVRRAMNAKAGTPGIAHDNPAIKRQKLEGGKSRQILTINKQSNLPHKRRNGTVMNSSGFKSLSPKTSKDRKIYVREPATPFISMAEMMNKFQSSTREMSLSRNTSLSQSDAAGVVMLGKPKLTLTRPKTPEFETSQRARPVKIKSSAEMEEEMMAKMPKFKARPLNKKIFEAHILPPLPKITPLRPKFKEFHLETMSRAANHNVETSSVFSTETTTEVKSHQWKPHLTAAKSPCLQTSLRARPPRIKSSEELETEELEKMPQFKARPLNRKIFESKGDMGIFCNMKKQITIPHEFHFATDERIPPPTFVADLFDKLSISSASSHQENPLPRNTIPNPFHLHTEERGAEKEKRMAEELIKKQLEEEVARVPKANPYPYTTDYPVVPPKPEPKPCTKPEPFQLESLLRHEEEIQREHEEIRRKEMEEAQMRIFRAQPILKVDPIPIIEKPRRPLTEVQEYDLHVDHRAVDRAEFDKKIKEKEMVYKRYREEAESARLMEEEKALKQLRRTLIPHARPVPKFDHPFLPHKSGREVTKAKSPKLHVDHRKGRRKMGRLSTMTTASHMR